MQRAFLYSAIFSVYTKQKGSFCKGLCFLQRHSSSSLRESKEKFRSKILSGGAKVL